MLCLDDGDGVGGGCWLDLCLLGFASGEQSVRVCGDCAGVTGGVACLFLIGQGRGGERGGGRRKGVEC